jgi:hypothetical protein
VIFLVAPDHERRVWEAVITVLLPEQLLAYLPAAGMREAVDELDGVGLPPFGDVPGQMSVDVSLANLASAGQVTRAGA